MPLQKSARDSLRNAYDSQWLPGKRRIVDGGNDQGEAMADKGGFIGVFDSGLGGISVLHHLVRQLPHEGFVFFGDSAHNPYGEKTPEQILGYARQIVGDLVDEGAKAIVIACNTATSVAAAALRDELPSLPIVGVEPALKPATEHDPHRRILVMATPVTLRMDKFQHLAHTYGSDSEIIEAPCEGLAQRIEQGELDGADLHELIENLVGRYRGGVDSVVLGCTHYPFVRHQIADVLGDVPFFDGGDGTARRVGSLLAKDGMLNESDAPGTVAFRSSLHEPGVLDRYQQFFEMGL